jgi:hypothetical protein
VMNNCRIVRIGIYLLGLMAMLLPTGQSLATGSEGWIEKEVDGYHVQLVFEEHLKTGPNEIEIRITEPGGSPLWGAVVEVSTEPAAEEHAASNPDANSEMMDNGHTDSPTMEGHVETESEADGHQDMAMGGASEGHPDMEVEVHEAAGGHHEAESMLLTEVGEEGRYTGQISFSEAGNWYLSVQIRMDEETAEKELGFPVDVVASSPPWGVISGFLGINLSIVAAAGFLKRKLPAAKS